MQEGCELHRMVRDDTVHTECGLAEGLLVHPFPAVGHVALLAGSLCTSCFPSSSVWTQLVRLAYPDKFRIADLKPRRGFGSVMNARAHPGVGPLTNNPQEIN
ncbi:hypothetical protein [Phytohabitans houttuyneae]|nr:hypothetical protein [Phytohabitans houttuyneae]